jgi:hypothetical protein
MPLGLVDKVALGESRPVVSRTPQLGNLGSHIYIYIYIYIGDGVGCCIDGVGVVLRGVVLCTTPHYHYTTPTKQEIMLCDLPR